MGSKVGSGTPENRAEDGVVGGERLGSWAGPSLGGLTFAQILALDREGALTPQRAHA